MSSVTVTLSSDCFYNYQKPLVEVGTLVRVKRVKRVWGEVTSSHSSGATMKGVYRPAPKSRLNNKTKFSKFKMKIIKLKNNKP